MEQNIKTSSQQNTVLLKKNEEARLEQLFQYFARSENNYLKFSEYILFAFDRGVISPKINFSILFDLFMDCMDEEQKPNKEKCISKHQFSYLIIQLSKILFPKDRTHVDKIFSKILSEKTFATKESIQVHRCPVNDEVQRKLVQEQNIYTICLYIEDTKSAFTCYMNENFKLGRILINWKELALQNKKLNSQSLIIFLKEAQIIPNLLGVEVIEDIMIKVVPPVNAKEHEFYNKHRLVYIYENEIESFDKNIEGDPKFQFHEFQLLLARISVEIAKEDKKDIEVILHNFFGKIIGFRQNEHIFSQNFPNINKKFFIRIQNYYKELQENLEKDTLIPSQGTMHTNQQNEQPQDDQGNDNVLIEDQELQDPNEKQAQELEDQVYNADITQLDYGEIFKILSNELPQIPNQPVIEQENPQPYQEDKDFKKTKKNPNPVQKKVILGDPIPPPPPNKNKIQVKVKQKQQLKKGEKPPRLIIWAGYPPPKPLSITEHFQNQDHELEFGEKNLTSQERGTLSEIEVIPVILSEIIYPEKIPKKVQIKIEAGINAHNKGNYLFALQNLEEAKVLQIKIEDRDLQEQQLLFYEFLKGQIYSSTGRDDYALNQFWICKSLSDRLTYINPDRSLAYCGLGMTFYDMEEYQFSLRCFLKARDIREKLFGVDHIDTSTIFNNLGCCFFMLQRSQEAMAYFQISLAVHEQQLGENHNRTQIVLQNVKKCEKGTFLNIPKFKMLWATYNEDPYPKKAKKKVDKKKKKR